MLIAHLQHYLFSLIRFHFLEIWLLLEKYTSSLYDEFSKNEKVKNLLGSIKSLSDIPIEILSKYYARLFTAESDFYKNINKDLGLNKKEKYLQYIKTLYEGVKLKSLPLASDNILYRGAKISKDEINIPFFSEIKHSEL